MADYADKIMTELALDGVDDVVAGYEKAGDAGEKNLGRVEETAAKANTSLEAVGSTVAETGQKFEAAGASMASALATVESGIANLVDGIVGLASNFAILGAAVALAIPAASGLASAWAATSEKITSAAAAAGTSADQFQTLQYAAQATGASASSMQIAFNSIERAMGQALAKGEDSYGAFKKLGIALVDTDGNARDTADVFRDLANVVAGIESPAEQASVASMALGRRAGPQLVQLLSEGSAGIDAYGKRLDELGGRASAASLAVGGDLFKAMVNFRTALQGLKNELGAVFSEEFANFFNRIATAIGQNKQIFIDFAGVLATLIAPALKIIAAAVETLLKALTFVNDAFGEAAKTINAVFGTSLTGMDVIVGLLIVRFTNWGSVITNLGMIVLGFGQTLKGLAVIIAQVFAANPVTVLIIALAGLALWLAKLAYENWPNLSTAAKAFFIVMEVGIAAVILALSGIPQAVYAIGAAIAAAMVANPWLAIAALILIVIGELALLAYQYWPEISAWIDKVKAGFEAWANSGYAAATLIVTGIGLILIAMATIPGVVAGISAAIGLALSINPVTALVIAIVGLLALLGTLAYMYWPEIKAAAIACWDGIVAGAQYVWDTITSLWNTGVQAVAGAFQWILDAANRIWEAVKTGVLDMWNYVVEKVQSAIEWVKRLLGLQAQAQGGGGQSAGATEGLAGGGMVRGPGSSTSDSILGWLSTGEYVVRAAAVRKYGLALLSAINGLQFNGFAMGGLVPSRMPALAAGGKLTHTLNLTIGEQTFAGLRAPEATAQQLIKYALGRQVRSGGRKPTWYGGQK